ncbi:MAG TPA: hypothetical protein VKU88_00380, partial [Acidimicrobiales bacterium]|nr:hypothetical protein [Acidimicrobiales bacterium]
MHQFVQALSTRSRRLDGRGVGRAASAASGPRAASVAGATGAAAMAGAVGAASVAGAVGAAAMAGAVGGSGRPRLYGDVPGAPGLAGWAKVFFGRPGPKVLAGTLAVVAARRARLGGWRAQDLVVAGAVVGLHPFAEWAVHVYILHGPSRRARRRAGGSPGEEMSGGGLP